MFILFSLIFKSWLDLQPCKAECTFPDQCRLLAALKKQHVKLITALRCLGAWIGVVLFQERDSQGSRCISAEGRAGGF